MSPEIETRKLYLLAFIASLLLSAIAISVDPVVNNDGIWYLSVARVFAAGEWLAAVRLDVFYEWPFYSFFIGVLSSVTGLDVESSAWLLNAIFAAVTMIALIAIVRELGGERRTQIIAAVVFLLFPALNDYRSYVLRDFGYVACYSVAFLLFLRSIKIRSLRYALAWPIVLLVGMLFRTEAVAFILAAPLAIFFMADEAWSERMRLYLRNNIVLIICGMFALVGLLYVGQTYPEKEIGSLIGRHIHRIMSAFTDTGEILGRHADSLRAGVLAHYSKGFSMAAALAMLILIFIFEVIKALTLPYMVLWWYGVRHGFSCFNQTSKKVWLAFIAINAVLISIFLFTSAFLVTRYILALTLTLLLVVPFLIHWLIQQWQAGRFNTRLKRSVVYVFGLFVIVLALDSFVSTGPGKGYLKDAGRWLSEEMQENETLYSSNLQVRFYADRIDLLDYQSAPKSALSDLKHRAWPEVKHMLDSGSHRQYDYLALQLRREKQKRLAYAIDKLGLEPVRLFENNKGRLVAIFRLKAEQ